MVPGGGFGEIDAVGLVGLQEPSGTWITVFGFPPSTETLVMQEFSRCGDILYFVSAREDGVNWTHIQYAVRFHAQYADIAESLSELDWELITVWSCRTNTRQRGLWRKTGNC